MCVNYKLCVKLHKGTSAFNMEKFHSLEKFYTHAVTGVTDNYQVWQSVVNMRISHPPPPITRRSCQSKIRLGLIMELSRLEQKLNCVAVFSQTEMPHLISRSNFYSSMQLLNAKFKPQQCAKLVALRRNSNGTKLHQS